MTANGMRVLRLDFAFAAFSISLAFSAFAAAATCSVSAMLGTTAVGLPRTLHRLATQSGPRRYTADGAFEVDANRARTPNYLFIGGIHHEKGAS